MSEIKTPQSWQELHDENIQLHLLINFYHSKINEANNVIMGLMSVLPDNTLHKENDCWQWAWDELGDEEQEIVKEKRHAANNWFEEAK